MISGDYFEIRAAVEAVLLNSAESLTGVDSKKAKLAALVRAELPPFYGLYSKFVGRAYPHFSLRKK
jgi:hypothetical protein